MMRIGLFGGTFNPVHNGHLEAARDVLSGLPLDRIIFIPAAYPPHKNPGWIADAENRLAMLKLALTDTPHFQLSEVELQRSGPSYTIDTVAYFSARYQNQGELFLIMGIDAFLEIDTWKSYLGLFSKIAMVVMSRPGNTTYTAQNSHEKIEAYLQAAVSTGFRYSTKCRGFVHSAYQPVIPLTVRPLPISATAIRDRLSRRQSIQSLVPTSVATYIHKRGLYR